MVMAYIVMVYVVMAYSIMAYIAMTYIFMACFAMACRDMACRDIAYIVMTTKAPARLQPGVSMRMLTYIYVRMSAHISTPHVHVRVHSPTLRTMRMWNTCL